MMMMMMTIRAYSVVGSKISRSVLPSGFAISQKSARTGKHLGGQASGDGLRRKRVKTSGFRELVLSFTRHVLRQSSRHQFASIYAANATALYTHGVDAERRVAFSLHQMLFDGRKSQLITAHTRPNSPPSVHLSTHRRIYQTNAQTDYLHYVRLCGW